MNNKEVVGIGILGLGNVGSGTLSILNNNQSFIEREIFPKKIKIVGISDIYDKRKPKSGRDYFFTTNAEEIVKHSDVDILVETIGGEYPAYDFIKKALQGGKHVVTPNKEVIAKHGYELLEIAEQKNVQLLFEPSVASAIPILGSIVNILTSCPLHEISGILNGTTNYILDLMLEHNMTKEEALKKAQEMGYAEADPGKDIDGVDTLYKIFILASLGFRGRLELDHIPYSGINKVTLEDINLAKQLNYRIKLLATARKELNKADIKVRPVLIKKEHLLSNIFGADNGIFLSGNCYGNLFLSGPGAGGAAAGSMIVSDIVKIIRQPQSFDYSFLTKDVQELSIEKLDEVQYSYFLRIKLKDKPENLENLKYFLLYQGLLSDKSDKIVEIKQEDSSLIIGLISLSVDEEKLKEAIKNMEELSYIDEISYLEVY